ncbi:MAG: hypothetical protein ACKV22_35530 [Bryobacteraceae bacterium]
MTKVDISFQLPGPLGDDVLANIAFIQSVYGIARVTVEPGLTTLRVEYDASRLMPRDVERVLRTAGIPVVAS